MHKSSIALAGALVVGMGLIGSAQAGSLGLPNATLSEGDHLGIVEPVHMMGHHNYCWYEDGWNGAGWYQCGYVWNKGYGWGGPYGWNGWASPMWGHRMGMSGHMMMGRGCCW